MCGIYGTTEQLDAHIIRKKLSSLADRGPNNSAHVTINNAVILGHTRLSIIDLNESANQPFKIGPYTITYNGELYNFQEIKETLVKNGITFRTNSDTEVLLQHYILKKEKCLSELNGMFAFVIYNEQTNEFFGARDRLGQKPFFCTHLNHKFEFSSNLTALTYTNRLQVCEIARKLYLNYGYIPDPLCIYKNAHKLPAGHYFTYNISKNEFKLNQYWELPEPIKLDQNYETTKASIKDLLTDSIKKRLLSDVPIGAFLSGGIDSSLIAAIASKHTSQRLKTFSIKFTESKFDESLYAEKIANKLGTNHTTINCSESEILDELPTYIQCYDEPFSDSSGLAQCLLAKHTKRQVTVALSGDGADELFFGYNRYKNIASVEFLYKHSYLRHILRHILKSIPHYKLNRISEGLSYSTLEDVYLYSIRTFNYSFQIDQLPFISTLKNNTHHILDRICQYDIKTYLNNDINTKVDRATMAYGLEARSPFMDYRLVEFAQKTSHHYKYKHNQTKYILKDILSDFIPHHLFNRPKQGFTVPLQQWFLGPLKPFVMSLLDQSNLDIIPEIDKKTIQTIIDNHMNLTHNNTEKIWNLLAYTNWFKSSYHPHT